MSDATAALIRAQKERVKGEARVLVALLYDPSQSGGPLHATVRKIVDQFCKDLDDDVG